MSSVVEILKYQIDYAAWANRRAFAAASALTPDELNHDFKSSEKSIRGTLAHIYRAERVWMSRIEGLVVEFREEGDDAMSALAANWPRVTEKWIEWSRTLAEERALSELTYQDLRENTWSQPLWQIVLHVVNHSTHHRGQAIGFIRSLGHTPPNVDSISFAREQSSRLLCP